MAQVIEGIAASNGVAIAKAYKLVDPDLSFDQVTIDDVQAEKDRVSAAFSVSKTDLEQIRDKAVQNMGADEAEVFTAHIMVLEDPELIGGIENAIETDKINAEAALKNVTDMYISMFEGMADDNPYMAERAADIRDVTKRVLSHLLGKSLPNPALIKEEVIIVAKDMTPSDTAQLDRQYVKGFITDLGGRTAHAAIMARTLEIPAVVGTGNASSLINDDDQMILNGLDGFAIVDPTDVQTQEAQAKGAAYEAQKAEWAKLKNERSVSADGKQFIVGSNIGTPKDLTGVLESGSEGIGLYRTEFLYMDSAELPTEEDQFQAYKAVLEGMSDKPVTVRTMDIGGDKNLPYLPLPKEDNPFMGYRAIRISLDRTDIFKTQLRALLRASVYGELWIMFPMIATIQEFRAARDIFEAEKAKLIAEGVAVSDDIKLGIMIEIPAAALLADRFAQEVDFFSIGTNDLIAYTMAADRGNENVSYLYQPYNPSILRIIKMVIDAAHKYGKFVAMCGEMAGDQIAVPILVGMGLDEFSMSSTSVLQTRALMKRLNTVQMAELAGRALNLDTNDEVKALVEAEVYAN
ncbi:phosphoenolpyruvate--protein phosphotransferase [Weissella diestrammenae]|uniref:Phosphoenolpyruvate-protein phosphotransferase n=1 Tax=Weissella diestrammenae TaxID=1162633 RepID=A0A7G9T6A7_9LACO|nr:phosphoenolpyruvate--protein phosphotransferase [Weissella diestrammenae]MCM0583322.1 phosphoenolpyruvate--protein phosphotransferase [Weissella diestrammenae]QNN75632.1 phosphoenolpyruvate--protein phosphotransferase [Weissella diestrammenae]